MSAKSAGLSQPELQGAQPSGFRRRVVNELKVFWGAMLNSTFGTVAEEHRACFFGDCREENQAKERKDYEDEDNEDD